MTTPDTQKIDCPHMTGDSVCTICRELDRCRRELTEVKERLAKIKRGDPVQGRLTIVDDPFRPAGEPNG